MRKIPKRTQHRFAQVETGPCEYFRIGNWGHVINVTGNTSNSKKANQGMERVIVAKRTRVTSRKSWRCF